MDIVEGEYLPETPIQKFKRILAGKAAPRKPVGSDVLTATTQPGREGVAARALQQNEVDVASPGPSGHVVAGSGNEEPGSRNS